MVVWAEGSGNLARINPMQRFHFRLSLVPKSGAEYAYLYETFAKLHKFWGPLPAFICNWVYVMVLRPAEVAILVLICVTYTLEPIRHRIGLDCMPEHDKRNLYKLLAMMTLCKATFYCSLFLSDCFVSTCFCFQLL